MKDEAAQRKKIVRDFITFRIIRLFYYIVIMLFVL